MSGFSSVLHIHYYRATIEVANEPTFDLPFFIFLSVFNFSFPSLFSSRLLYSFRFLVSVSLLVPIFHYHFFATLVSRDYNGGCLQGRSLAWTERETGAVYHCCDRHAVAMEARQRT